VVQAVEFGVAPTIRNIESINISIDSVFGNGVIVDAANITGSTITLSSSRAGFDGLAGVANVGKNNVSAGSGVSELEVYGLTSGTVNTGSVEYAYIESADAAATTKVNVNGDIELELDEVVKAEISVSAAATIELVDSDGDDLEQVTVSGKSNVTLAMSAGDIDARKVVNDLASGAKLSVSITSDGGDGNINLTKVSANSISLAHNFDNDTFVLANGTALNVTKAQTGTVVLQGDPSRVTNSVTLTTTEDLATLNVSDDGLTTSLVVSDGVKITNLIATGENVVVQGSGVLEIVSSDAEAFNATAFTGTLKYTASAVSAIFGGSGNNTITIEDHDAVYTGQSGIDTFILADDYDSKLTANLGAGDDVFKLGEQNGNETMTLTVDFGSGTDRLVVSDGTDLVGTDYKISFSNLEEIELVRDTGAITFSLNSSVLSGKTYKILTEIASDTVEVSVIGDAATINLGSLTFGNITASSSDTFYIEAKAATASTITGTSINDYILGSSAKDTINGGAGDDTIEASGGADVLTGGAGADTFVFFAGDSSKTAVDTITDFSIADFDVIELADQFIDIVTGIDAASNLYVGGAAALTDNLADSAIRAVVSNGFLTLDGTDANVAKINTLDEWFAVAEIVFASLVDNTYDGGNDREAQLAFVFNGDTYVISANLLDDDNDEDIDPVVTVGNVIKLAGISTLTALGETAAVGTIVLTNDFVL
jgi:trimeric autotransporter adhesin